MQKASKLMLKNPSELRFTLPATNTVTVLFPYFEISINSFKQKQTVISIFPVLVKRVGKCQQDSPVPIKRTLCYLMIII